MTKQIFLTLLLATTILIYGASLKYGFSQDDWYFLLISRASSITDILNFFNPTTQSGFPFFRPLGTQLYYYLAVRLFGLNHAPIFMHLFMLIVQLLSAYQVYKLILNLKHSQLTAQYTALAYAGASSLFLSLYYLAATQQLLATFFSLLALNSSLRQKNLSAGVFWALALLSKESAIMTPVLMLTLSYFLAGVKSINTLLRRSLPYFVVGLAYIALRLAAPLTLQSEYHLAFGANVLSTLRWFFLFGYGAAEEWIKYATLGGGVDLVAYIKDYGFLALANVLLTLFLTLLALVAILRRVRQFSTSLYIAWFILGLLPVLFLVNHRYPHYLDLSLIPLLLLLLEGFPSAKKILTLLLIASSFFSVLLSTQVHWTTGRATISARAQKAFTTEALCAHESITFLGPAPYPTELGYALSLENGPRVICSNPNLKVEYTSATPLGEGIIVDPIWIVRGTNIK